MVNHLEGISLLRHEKKYYINFSDYYNVVQRLSNFFDRDPNGGTDNRYRVRSIYFDNKSELNVLKKEIVSILKIINKIVFESRKKLSKVSSEA